MFDQTLCLLVLQKWKEVSSKEQAIRLPKIQAATGHSNLHSSQGSMTRNVTLIETFFCTTAKVQHPDKKWVSSAAHLE